MSKPVTQKNRQRCRGCRQYKGWGGFDKNGYCPSCTRKVKK